MSDDITFNKAFDFKADTAREVAPGVRAMVADNPGPFTFKGTMSYIIGRGKVAILDPGPDDDAHVAALLDAVRNETVTHIFVTHTHRDHSPAVPKKEWSPGAGNAGAPATSFYTVSEDLDRILRVCKRRANFPGRNPPAGPERGAFAG